MIYLSFVPFLALMFIGGDLDVTTGTVIAGAAPLIYATIGETITEKAGVVNLSLDGSLLLSAMAGFAGAKLSGHVIPGFLLAAAVSALRSLITAWYRPICSGVIAQWSSSSMRSGSSAAIAGSALVRR